MQIENTFIFFPILMPAIVSGFSQSPLHFFVNKTGS